MKQITGAYTAIITPFDDQSQIDEAGLRDNLRFQMAHSIDGIVVLGTTGEATTLSDTEKETVIHIAREEIDGRVPLIIGIGGSSTQETIHKAHTAHNLGADCLLAVTPLYVKPTQEGIYKHFSALAEAVEIPIMLYNHPGRSGANIDPQTIERLSKIDHIIGVKEASNINQINAVIETVCSQRPEFAVMCGDDPLTFLLLALGGHGVISVASNLVPGQLKNMVKAAQEGNYTKAREIHFHLMPLFRGLALETNPIPVKAAMNLCGHAAGGYRLPLCELSSAHEKELKEALDKTTIALGTKVY